MSNENYDPPKGLDALDSASKLYLLNALKDVIKRVPLNRLELAIRKGDVESILQEIKFAGLGEKLTKLNEYLAKAYVNGAKHGVKYLDGKFTLGFDLINKNAVEYARTQVGNLIVQITEDARQTVRDAVARSLNGELTVQQVARQLKSSIGLHSKYADAVSKYEERQINRLVREGEDVASASERASMLSEKYANKLLNVRTQTIARTEIIDSANQGLLDNWNNAIENGFAEKGSLKQWNAEPDACPLCSEIDGFTAELDQPFTQDFKTGKDIFQPPYHPNCRCSMALVPPDEANPYE